MRKRFTKNFKPHQKDLNYKLRVTVGRIPDTDEIEMDIYDIETGEVYFSGVVTWQSLNPLKKAYDVTPTWVAWPEKS